MLYVVEAEFENPSFARNEALGLREEAPDLRGYIEQRGSFLIVKNTSKKKAEECKKWFRNYTSPKTIKVRKAETHEKYQEKWRKWSNRFQTAGSHLMDLKKARRPDTTSGGLLGFVRDLNKKYSEDDREVY